MGGPPENVHGRKGGRGLRPWLLIPKVLAVSVYFGGLVAAATIWISDQTVLYYTFTANEARPWPTVAAATLDHVRTLVLFVTVPALIVAILAGIALYLEHPGVFIRQRWWQVKIALLAVGIPAAHVFMSSRLAIVRQSQRVGAGPNIDAVRQASWGFAAVIAISAVAILLGRLKPRLGQNWARAYRKRRAPSRPV